MRRLTGCFEVLLDRALIAVIAVAFCALVSPIAASAELQLLPQPREVQTKASLFRVTSRTRILVSSRSEEDRFAAKTLQEYFKFLSDHEVPMVTGSMSAQRPTIILGRINDPGIARLIAKLDMNTNDIPAEGYVLDVEKTQILIAGKDGAGLFYGVQTLRQMVSQSEHGLEISGAQIRDWPAMRYRGTQVDLSRGPVPTLDYLKEIVRTIAEYKMNQLNLYIEDAFPLEGNPLIGLLDDVHSRASFKELVAYAAPHHVEIIPATQACGHLHKVLRFQQYSDMGERDHGLVLAADNERASAYLNDFFRQVASVFPSPMYNIGCDETFELGKGRSANQVQSEGFGKVYARNVARAAEAARKQGKQPIFWGDMVVAHPDAVSTLPKDLIVASWEYYPRDSYAKWIKPFTDANMRLIVCPWVGNTGLIVPDYEAAAINIATFLDEGKKAGALGTNVTVWNDSGENLYAPNWWPIVFGASNAWEQNKVNVADFDSKFDWAFFRIRGSRLTNAIKELGHINVLMREKMDTGWGYQYGGAGDNYFWKDPFGATAQGEVGKARAITTEMRLTAEKSYTVLTESRNSVPYHAETLDALRFAALKLDALGMRYQYVQEISDKYHVAIAQQANPGLVTEENRESVKSTGRFADLRDYTTRLREMYRQLWLSENLPQWLPNMLQRYDRNSDLWQRWSDQFADLADGQEQGKPLPPPESLGLQPASTK